MRSPPHHPPHESTGPPAGKAQSPQPGNANNREHRSILSRVCPLSSFGSQSSLRLQPSCQLWGSPIMLHTLPVWDSARASLAFQPVSHPFLQAPTRTSFPILVYPSQQEYVWTPQDSTVLGPCHSWDQTALHATTNALLRPIHPHALPLLLPSLLQVRANWVASRTCRGVLQVSERQIIVPKSPSDIVPNLSF